MHKDCHSLWLIDNRSQVYEPNHRTEYIICQYQDITEQSLQLSDSVITSAGAIPDTADIPVIAISAIAHEHDIAAGFYRYLTKPLKQHELEEAMHYALQEHSHSASGIQQAG